MEVLEDGVCSIMENNLGLASYWWIIPFIQLFVYLLLFSLQTLCNLATILRFITINSINTFYLNFSLWIWLVFALTAMTYCRIGKSCFTKSQQIRSKLDCSAIVDLSNPVLITSIVFVGLFAVLSVLDCFLGEDGWYLVDLKQAQDAKHYFGRFSM